MPSARLLNQVNKGWQAELKPGFHIIAKELHGIAASRNKSDQVCVQLSVILRKSAKNLRFTATRCNPLRLMETTIHNFCSTLR